MRKIPRSILARFILFSFLTIVPYCGKSAEGPRDAPIPTGRGLISGVVVNSSGFPVAAAYVETDINGSHAETRTSEQGQFSLVLPKVKLYQGCNVRVTLDGLEPANRPVIFDTTAFTVDAGKIILLPVHDSTSRSIAGKVVDRNGVVLQGVSIGLQDAAGNPLSAVSDQAGLFSVQSTKFPLYSSFVLTLSKIGYLTDSSVIIAITGNTNTFPAPIILRNATSALRLSLTDQSGSLVQSAVVTTIDSMGNSLAAQPDGQGYILLSDYLMVGTTYSVNIAKPGFRSVARDVTMDAMAVTDIGTIVVQKKLSLNLSLSPSNLSGSVSAYSSQGSLLTASSFTGSSVTAEIIDGQDSQLVRYEIQSANYEIYSGSCTLTTANGGCSASVSLTPVSNTGTTCFGRIENFLDDSPIAGATIRVTDGSNNVKTASTDANGDYSLQGNFTANASYQFLISANNFTGSTNVMEATGISCQTNVLQATRTYLYPIGIYVKPGNGNWLRFGHDVQFDTERWLDKSVGPTLTARTSTDLTTSSEFYVHADFDSLHLPTSVEPAVWLDANGGPRLTYFVEPVVGDVRPRSFGLDQTQVFLVSTFGAQANGAQFNPKISMSTFGCDSNCSCQYKLVAAANWDLCSISGQVQSFNAQKDRIYHVKLASVSSNAISADVLAISDLDMAYPIDALNWSNQVLALDLSYYDGANHILYYGSGAINAVQAPLRSGKLTANGIYEHGRPILFGKFSVGAMNSVSKTGISVQFTEGFFNIVR